MTNLKEKILEKALILYNEQGIEYIGMRQLAQSLDIKLGNITYYFPKKDDLVYHIWNQLATSNQSIIQSHEIANLVDYINFADKYFENQYRYRCLYWSFVHAIYQNTKISINYKEHINNRNKVLIKIFKRLIKEGFLIPLSKEELDFINQISTMVFRHWIMEKKISSPNASLSDVKIKNLKIILNLLVPYYTSKGIKSYKKIFIDQLTGL